MGLVAILGSCDPNHLKNFSFLKAMEATYEIWFTIGQEKLFKIVDGRMTDERIEDRTCLYYKLPQSLWLR